MLDNREIEASVSISNLIPPDANEDERNEVQPRTATTNPTNISNDATSMPARAHVLAAARPQLANSSIDEINVNSVDDKVESIRSELFETTLMGEESSIDYDLNYIENLFLNIDQLVDDCESRKVDELNELDRKIQKLLSSRRSFSLLKLNKLNGATQDATTIESNLKTSLLRQRDRLLRQLNEGLRSLIEYMSTCKQDIYTLMVQKLVQIENESSSNSGENKDKIECLNEYLFDYLNGIRFKESTRAISTLCIGNLVYKNQFNLIDKLRYMKFLNQFDEVKLIEKKLCDNINVRLVVLTRHKFFLMEQHPTTNELADVSASQDTDSHTDLASPESAQKQSEDAEPKKTKPFSILKVVNSKCETLATRTIHAKYVYKSVMGNESVLVGLFYEPHEKFFILNVYDMKKTDHSSHLELISSRKFHHEIALCSLNENEICCWLWDTKQCIVLNYRLVELFRFGQDGDETKPFYFDHGKLIDSTLNYILFYFYDCHDPTDILNMTHYLKIIDRRTGLVNGLIDMEFAYFSKTIHLDSRSSVLLKLYEPKNLIKYYDLKGNLITEFPNSEFSRFERIELSRTDNIVCYDLSKTSTIIFI